MAHREISVSVTQTSVAGGTAHADGGTTRGEESPEICPDCGSTSIHRLLDVADSFSVETPLLKAAVDEGRLHLFCSPDNQVWICDRSLQQMKENS